MRGELFTLLNKPHLTPYARYTFQMLVEGSAAALLKWSEHLSFNILLFHMPKGFLRRSAKESSK